MELNREQLAHGVLTSALFGIGALVGNALIGVTLTGISVNMASTLVQSTWGKFCREYLLEPNHDLQKIWARAVRRSLSQLEELWWKTPRGSQIERGDGEQKTAIKQLFRQLQTESGQFFGAAAQAAQTADAYFDLAQPVGVNPPSASQVFAVRMQRYLEGHDGQLIAFFAQHFLDIFGFCFVEELKSDDPDSNRAWRALQLFLLRDLSSQLSRVEVGQQTATQLLKEIDARTKRIELDSIQPTIPPPDKPIMRAATAFFVGREVEMAYFAEQLSSRRVAVLTGIAGLGKTELALRLAREAVDEDRIFWHTFYDRDDLSMLLWKVAEFLYWQGQQDLWRRLSTAGFSDRKSPPEILLEYLMPALRGKDYLFCLDGLPFVEQDSQMDRFLEKLVSAARDGQLSLLVTSRHSCARLAEFTTEPLSGMTAGEAQRLLASQDVSLAAEQYQVLHQSTGGNPQILMLSADLLWHSAKPAEIIDGLIHTDDIQRYLFDEISKGLSDEQKHTLSVMSALFGYPASRDAVEALLDGPSAREVLRTLSQRYLVVVHGGSQDRRYTVHPALQEFYYDDLSRTQRRQVHRRAGEYYETEEVNALEAAFQYQRADLTDKAIELATTNAWHIITRGHARRLQHLLASLQTARSNNAQQVKVEFALGEVSEISGDYKEAMGHFEAALARFKESPDLVSEPLLASEIARRLGRLYGWQGELGVALDWMQIARTMLASCSGDQATEALAMVEIHSASLSYQMGDYPQAEALAQRGLDLLGAKGGLAARAEGYLLLGASQDAQGKSLDGLAAYQTSLNLWESQNDTYQMARVNNNIGAAYFNRDEWSRAFEIYENVYRFFSEKVEDQHRLASTATNLGLLAYNRGDYGAAQKYHAQAIMIAQGLGIQWLAAVARVNMAWVHLAWHELDKAEELADENVRLESVSEIAESVPESYRVLAVVAARRGLLSQAFDHAQQALDVAREQSNKLEEANAQRVLGKVLRLQNQLESAQQHLFASLAQLDALPNRFEAARTKRQLVWLHKERNDDSAALVYAIDALTTFAAMDARGELSSMQANNRLTFGIQRFLSTAIEQTSAMMTDLGWIRQELDSPAALTDEQQVLCFSIDPHTAQLTFVANGPEVVLTIQVLNAAPAR